MTRAERPEFVSRAILQWLMDAHIETAIINPGKPWQNGTKESLNNEFQSECLGIEVPNPSRSPSDHRSVARGLQRSPTAFEPPLLDPA